jgi:hypothetical protein
MVQVPPIGIVLKEDVNQDHHQKTLNTVKDNLIKNVKNLLLKEQLNGKMVLTQQKEKHPHSIVNGQNKKSYRS